MLRDQPLRGDVPPGVDHRRTHHVFRRRSQVHVGGPAPSPAALDGGEHIRLQRHPARLLLRRQLDHSPIGAGRTERGEDLALHSEIRMVHMRGFDRLGQAECELTKFIRCHAPPRAFNSAIAAAIPALWPKMPVPTTKTLAPAPRAVDIVFAAMPPSTSSSHFGLCLSMSARSRRMRSGLSGKNSWPPNPGHTVMHRARSIRGSTGSSASTGVPGLMTIPTLLPRPRILSISGRGSATTS